MNPLEQFTAWYDEARAAAGLGADVVALATATPDGRPSVRMVLYRGLSEGGLRFFTSYESRKGVELEANPRAALCFYWAPPDRQVRQVRIEGRVERLSARESDDYFRSRPRGSQLSAACSPQSRPIASRAELLARRDALARQLAEGEVPRPPAWGGYRLLPDRIELWTAGEDRLHERVLFARRGDEWVSQLLGP